MTGETSITDQVGIMGGAVTLLGLVGAAIKWLAVWGDRRAASRTVKLQAWHDELTAREARIDREREEHHRSVESRLASIEERYEKLNREHMAIRLAFDLVTGALRAIDPSNRALRQAEQLLGAAFPLLPEIPTDMGNALARMNGETE